MRARDGHCGKMAAPRKSAFEDLQSFVEGADDEFARMDAERTYVIGCLRKSLEASGHVAPVRESLLEEPAASCSAASACSEVEVGRSEVDVGSLERAIDEVMGAGPNEADERTPELLPDGAPDRIKGLMDRDPDFARIALLMVSSPLSVDWNDPAVINVEQTLIFEFKYHKKFKHRGPPGPLQGGPKEWRGQPWREKTGRWGSRGGRGLRLAEFQAKFGKERGTQAFLEDEDKRRSLRLESFVAKFGKERGTQAFEEDEAARARKSKGVARMMAVGPPKVAPPKVPPKLLPPIATTSKKMACPPKPIACHVEPPSAGKGKGSDGEAAKGTCASLIKGKGRCTKGEIFSKGNKGAGENSDAGTSTTGKGKDEHKWFENINPWILRQAPRTPSPHRRPKRRALKPQHACDSGPPRFFVTGQRCGT